MHAWMMHPGYLVILLLLAIVVGGFLFFAAKGFVATELHED